MVCYDSILFQHISENIYIYVKKREKVSLKERKDEIRTRIFRKQSVENQLGKNKSKQNH